MVIILLEVRRAAPSHDKLPLRRIDENIARRHDSHSRQALAPGYPGAKCRPPTTRGGRRWRRPRLASGLFRTRCRASAATSRAAAATISGRRHMRSARMPPKRRSLWQIGYWTSVLDKAEAGPRRGTPGVSYAKFSLELERGDGAEAASCPLFDAAENGGVANPCSLSSRPVAIPRAIGAKASGFLRGRASLGSETRIAGKGACHEVDKGAHLRCGRFLGRKYRVDRRRAWRIICKHLAYGSRGKLFREQPAWCLGNAKASEYRGADILRIIGSEWAGNGHLDEGLGARKMPWVRRALKRIDDTCMLSQVFRRQRLASAGQIMRARNRHPRGQPNSPRDQCGILQLTDADREVESLFDQIDEAIGHDEIHRDVRIQLLKRRQERHDVQSAEPGRQGDAEPPGWLYRAPANEVFGGLEIPHDAQHCVIKQMSGVGRPYVPGRAMKQLDAEMGLQPGDLLADRGLTDIRLARDL